MIANKLEALLNIPEILHAKLSPNTQWAIWEWAGADNAIQVYAAPTDASQPPIRLSQGDQNTYLVSITPDSTAAIVAQDKGGDERVGLYRVQFSHPGQMEPLTEPEPNYYIRGGDLHPDGQTLVYTANIDQSGKEIEASWVYRHDLTTNERTALACPSRSAGQSNPQLSPDGQHILYIRKDEHPASRHLWLVGINGANDHEIANPGSGLKAYGSWLNESTLIILADTETHARLGLYDIDSDSLRWLIDDPERNFEEIYRLPGDPGHALVIESRFSSKYSWLLNTQTGELAHISASEKPQILLGKNDDSWISLVYSSTQPMDIIRLNAKSDTQTSITRVWERVPLQSDDLTPAEDYRWRSVDSLEIQGWLYRAPDAIGTIVWVHGGPTWHSENWINTEIQAYTANGFNVLDPNYRGSTGFSHIYQEAIKEDGWGGREQDDIRTGIEQLIADGIATPGKIGITGLSYGGYSSWCAITRFSPHPITAAAPVCGMTDLVVDYETTRPDLRPYCAEMMKGTPDEVPELYKERSPIHFVHQIQGKLLIVQGMRDPNVTPANVEAVEDALNKAGIPYEKLTFEDEGHGIERKANKAIMYQKIADFFKAAFANTAS